MVGLLHTEQAHLYYGDQAGIEAVGRTLALGRLGEPGEVADVVLFCASPLASFMSGASVPVHRRRRGALLPHRLHGRGSPVPAGVQAVRVWGRGTAGRAALLSAVAVALLLGAHSGAAAHEGDEEPLPIDTGDDLRPVPEIPAGAGRIIGSPEAGPKPQQSGDRGRKPPVRHHGSGGRGRRVHHVAHRPGRPAILAPRVGRQPRLTVARISDTGFPAPVRCAHGPLGPRPRSAPCEILINRARSARPLNPDKSDQLCVVSRPQVRYPSES